MALSFGAYVIRRPEELATDDATTGSVLLHALEWLEPDAFDMVVCLHPTSPIRDPRHIDDAIELLASTPGWNVVASVYELPRKTHKNIGTFDIWNEPRWVGKEGSHYILNASIYCMTKTWLMQSGEHVAPWCIPFVMDRRHSLDIDDEIDLKIAELFLNDNH